MIITCPKCKSKLRIPEHLQGKTAQCKCGTKLRISGPATGQQKQIPKENTAPRTEADPSDLFANLDISSTGGNVSKFAVNPTSLQAYQPSNQGVGSKNMEQTKKRSAAGDLLHQANQQLESDSLKYSGVQSSGTGTILRYIGHGFMCIIYTALIGWWCGCFAPMILAFIAKRAYDNDDEVLFNLYMGAAVLNLLIPIIIIWLFGNIYANLLF